MNLGHLNIHMQRNEVESLIPYIIYKHYVKWIKDPDIRDKTKNSQKKMSIKFHDLDLGNDFLDLTPKG